MAFVYILHCGYNNMTMLHVSIERVCTLAFVRVRDGKLEINCQMLVRGFD